MNWFEALILGLVQGLTEFLPVSSSGHLELGKAILGIQARDNLTFSIVVHGATVLSILVVFWKDIVRLFTQSFRWEYNDSSSYVLKILVSMVPVGIVGAFFKDQVESYFTGNILLVGSMLLITATLLIITHFVPEGAERTRVGKEGKGRDISFFDAFIIGIAQAVAVMPGISRSGATITTALFLGNKRAEAARFSFLMVILPIIAANILDLKDILSAAGSEIAGSGMAGSVMADTGMAGAGLADSVMAGSVMAGSGSLAADAAIGLIPLLIGFLTAFISGLIACRWMLKIVSRGKLLYFGIYCLIVGIIAIFAGL